jgi:hypothetical protein
MNLSQTMIIKKIIKTHRRLTQTFIEMITMLNMNCTI